MSDLTFVTLLTSASSIFSLFLSPHSTSSAYNALEGHSFSLEGQLRETQSKLKETVALKEAAVLQAQQQAAAAPPPVQQVVGVPEPEVAQRVADAVAAAVAQSEQDGEEAMNDLLVCLGQVWKVWE